MTEHTPLDAAHVRAEAEGTDLARLSFFERLAEAELHLILDDAAELGADATVTPRLVEVEGDRYALGFDLVERLEAFAGGCATVTVSGRRLAALLAHEGLGLALNLGGAPSAQLLPPDAIAWLSRTLAHEPQETDRRIAEIAPPGRLPEALLTALDGKLRLAAGLARYAYLAQAVYGDGMRSHVLGIVDPVPGGERDLARAVSEALVFSGLEAGTLDVVFLRASQPLTARLARHGLRIDLPAPAPAGPVRDPDAPPRLR
ncbi:SseB family protein [Jannaschia sp. S6380]|uniref:SseB family protein n=1 Tax=Jannaschia sp. S6380 TaxID=2926408 RepID=UPI001FF631EF|nr:SseB family protein [Jannaschia sp. S6380]MCK0166100.1 SseB family protein [Jannaschia sp. S6380]